MQIIMNPIRLACIKLSLERKEFSESLGYANIHNYAYHEKEFTPDIIERIKNKYETDLSADIISYLKYLLKHEGYTGHNIASQQRGKSMSSSPQSSIFDLIK